MIDSILEQIPGMSEIRVFCGKFSFFVFVCCLFVCSCCCCCYFGRGGVILADGYFFLGILLNRSTDHFIHKVMFLIHKNIIM